MKKFIFQDLDNATLTLEIPRGGPFDPLGFFQIFSENIIIFLKVQWSCAISPFIPIASMSLSTQLFDQCFHRSTSAHHIRVHTIPTLLSGSYPRHIQCPNDLIVQCYAFYPLMTLHMHILRTIILSAFINLSRSSVFISHVLISYINTLWTRYHIISPSVSKRHPFLAKLVLAH